MTRNTMPPDHSRLGHAGSALGACLAKAQRFDEAERHLLEAQQIPGQGSGTTEEASANARHLVALYERTGRIDEAARYRR